MFGGVSRAQVAPVPTDLEQRLINTPFGAASVAMFLGGLEGAQFDGDAPLGEPLPNVNVAEAIPQIPADGERDDLGGEAVPAKGRVGTDRPTPTTANPAKDLVPRMISPCLCQLLTRTPPFRLRPENLASAYPISAQTNGTARP